MRRLWMLMLVLGMAGVVGANERADMCREMGGSGAYTVLDSGQLVCYIGVGGGGTGSGWVPWDRDAYPKGVGVGNTPAAPVKPAVVKEPTNVLTAVGSGLQGGIAARNDAPKESRLDRNCREISERISVATAVTVAAIGGSALMVRALNAAEWGTFKLPFGLGPELLPDTWEVDQGPSRYTSKWDAMWSMADDTAAAQAAGHSVPKGWRTAYSAMPPVKAAWTARRAAGFFGRVAGPVVVGIAATRIGTELYMDSQDPTRNDLETFMNTSDLLMEFLTGEDSGLPQACEGK